MKIKKGFSRSYIKGLDIYFDMGSWEGDDFVFHISFIGLYFSLIKFTSSDNLSGKILKKILGKGMYNENRTLGLFIKCDSIGLYLPNKHEKMEDYPKYIGLKWGRLIDKVFGYKFIGEKVLEVRNDEIILPSYKNSRLTKTHKFELIISKRKWKNRVGFKKQSISANVDFKQPIECPGKGTSSYNCGDDATYSMSFPIKGRYDRYKILKHIASNTYERRFKYYD